MTVDYATLASFETRIFTNDPTDGSGAHFPSLVDVNFRSLDELRRWVPTCEVVYVVIIVATPPVRRDAYEARRDNARTHVVDDRLIITSPTIEGAVAACDWAYDLPALTATEP